mgnify:FL=1
MYNVIEIDLGEKDVYQGNFRKLVKFCLEEEIVTTEELEGALEQYEELEEYELCAILLEVLNQKTVE